MREEEHEGGEGAWQGRRGMREEGRVGGGA